ncbi:MAG: magnesium transporter [Candidatus Lokiarchaeota archaeon]|nr:magnesium transporter [Candidatus Lokiarchaeota archaeon]
MDYFIKVIKESIIVVIISSLIGILSGTFLSTNENILSTIPFILLLLPAINSLIGDISTIMISRLTTHLLIGSIPPSIKKSKRLIEDFIGLLLTILLSLAVLLIVGHIITYSTDISLVNPIEIEIIIILTIIIMFGLIFFMMFISSIFLFKRGKDPNNFLIPFITSLIDFLNPFLIIVFITIFI